MCIPQVFFDSEGVIFYTACCEKELKNSVFEDKNHQFMGTKRAFRPGFGLCFGFNWEGVYTIWIVCFFIYSHFGYNGVPLFGKGIKVPWDYFSGWNSGGYSPSSAGVCKYGGSGISD